MKQYKRILSIQDISCVGQCSTTVVLPIISACGIETCILPRAILSTHTGGFKNYTVHDMVDEIPYIIEHWQKEGISFDAIVTGYLGSERHVSIVENISETLLRSGGILIVDPAMADNGRLYPAFDDNYVEAMKTLCSKADIILPNLTEACLLAGTDIPAEYDSERITELSGMLDTSASIIMTGIGFAPDETGVFVVRGNNSFHYAHHRIVRNYHGTGDIFTSAFAGAYLTTSEIYSAVKIAADYTLSCIENSIEDEKHWYGVKFEPMLNKLMQDLNSTVQL